MLAQNLVASVGQYN